MPTRIEKAEKRVAELDVEVDRKLTHLSDPLNKDVIADRAEVEVNSRGMMEDIIRKRFNSQSSNGVAWKPDKPDTLKKKAKKGEESGTLVATGALKAAAIRAAANTFSLTEPIRFDLNKIPLSYAKVANKKRKFYSAPSNEELKPALAVVSQTIINEILNLLKK